MAMRSRISTFCFVYQPIDEVEKLEYYRPGGFHPILVGHQLHQRYRIVHKLGHGGFSTTWLAQDQLHSRYVAVKVAISDSNHHDEYDVLASLAGAPVTSQRHPTDSLPLFPTVLDRFHLDGPNGSHACLVTSLGRCSLADAREASTRGLFQTCLARALAAQLALALERIHDQKYAHGETYADAFSLEDLHLGNVLLHLPSDLDHLSEAQLYDKFGAPEPIPVIRLDGEPVPLNVPSHAFSPVWLGVPSEKIALADAKIFIIDFGVAFRPFEESRLEANTTLGIRPPEAHFDNTRPLSFASDIWTLACTIWAIMGHGPLFDAWIWNDDDMVCDQVDTLGRLPPEWWTRWEARSEKFTEAGQQPLQGRSVWSWEKRFEHDIQAPRREKGMETMDAAETEAFFSAMRSMLAFRPRDRPTTSEVLEMPWMRDWALPAYRGISTAPC